MSFKKKKRAYKPLQPPQSQTKTSASLIQKKVVRSFRLSTIYKWTQLSTILYTKPSNSQKTLTGLNTKGFGGQGQVCCCQLLPEE